MCFCFIQVNAYDSVHVVDSLYRSKYLLTSMSDFSQDLKLPSSMRSLGGTDDSHLILLPENRLIDNANSQRKINLSEGNLHKVTILNLPEVVSEPSNENQTNNSLEGSMQGKTVLPAGDNEDETFLICSGEVCMPILPWINGDGTINKIVYKGLRRCVLGLVMQNPGILEVHAFFNSCMCFTKMLHSLQNLSFNRWPQQKDIVQLSRKLLVFLFVCLFVFFFFF